ncbi:hypothetical protein BD779DRAFT_584334 [Infundibulicybe gibba]|nr:hypothetical protein BD779DRAFT_584334 [Infundibulicybe gibba]
MIKGDDRENAQAQWMMAKKLEQNHRLTHAALCECWRAHWVYPRSEDRNIYIVICLLIILLSCGAISSSGDKILVFFLENNIISAVFNELVLLFPLLCLLLPPCPSTPFTYRI